jgi:hypothetical protein
MFKGLPDVSQDICSCEDRKQPLQLAFEVREGERGGGVVGEDAKHPLRLAFEAREGEWVVVVVGDN